MLNSSQSTPATGYSHSRYAESLSELGIPQELRHGKAWILVRPIPGFSVCDAIGCYPLFCCQEWSRLHLDLEELAAKLISLAVVIDPFGGYDPAGLRDCFRDVVRPFKEHFIVDLSHSTNSFIDAHHRRNARKALRELLVENCINPLQYLDDWTTLYDNLIKRHRITGIARFSKNSFAHQLRTPGMVMFRAAHEDVTVGMLLWYVQGEVAYYHLGAYNSRGYEMRASFALFWRAIEYFAELRLQWLNLGAGAGIDGNVTDGLSRFKRGWSTGTRTVYFCGRIFDHGKYSEIATAKMISAPKYFPAYRQGEFA